MAAVYCFQFSTNTPFFPLFYSGESAFLHFGHKKTPGVYPKGVFLIFPKYLLANLITVG